MILIFLLLLSVVSSEKRVYDAYKGTPISLEEFKVHVKQNTTFWCTVEVEDCKPNEGHRLDGSCNNPKYPTRGATITPLLRVLPAIYDKGFEPRKAKSGKPLPLARLIRTSLLSEGRVPDQTFTQLMTHFWVFMTSEVVGVHDTVNYIEWTPYCCLPKGKTDPMCTPNPVPADDPVFRFSDIRCLNLTRPFSFQNLKCRNNNTTPDRLSTATPMMDLSTVYGSTLKAALKARTYAGGMLKQEVENGRIWPPGDGLVCRLNQRPHETRCHATPEDGVNSLAGVNIALIWFWRQHNRIATELAKLNPCWDDEKLFYTARDINIAIAIQIYYYEMLPLILGRDNMIKDNVITPLFGFRDFYDPTKFPQITLEFPYVMRWVHTVQEGRLKMYDPEGNYLKQFPYVNLTLRTGYFAVDNNIDYLTQGSFRQPSGKFDYIVDPDLAAIGLGPHQRASDLMTSDVAKARYFGFPPYIKYREFCSGRRIKSFEDLSDIIDPERIERLKDVYEDVEDIDLIAGIWVEKHVRDGFAPPTLYCLMVDQLLRNMRTDRHWYERPNRPNAFTVEQLQEIRKATIARVLCDVGDTVTKIQPAAFLRARRGNEICSCDLIPKVDLRAWRDPTCGPTHGVYPDYISWPYQYHHAF